MGRKRGGVSTSLVRFLDLYPGEKGEGGKGKVEGRSSSITPPREKRRNCRLAVAYR